DALEEQMSDTLPQPARIPNDELARWNNGRLPDGLPPRRLLPGLLLGVDVRAFRGGSHEPYLGRGADWLRSDREDWTGRLHRRTRRRSRNGCPRDRGDCLKPIIQPAGYTGTIGGARNPMSTASGT